jgi:hypothetical protein
VAKRFLSIPAAAQHPDCPFDERGLRNRLAASKPKFDTSGNVVDPGDPEFLGVFVRTTPTAKGQLLVDIPRLLTLLDSRRLAHPEAAKAA